MVNICHCALCLHVTLCELVLDILVSHLALNLSLFNIQQVHAHPQITNPRSARRKPIRAPIAVSVAVGDSSPSSSVVIVGLTPPASLFVLEAVEDYKCL